MLADLGDDLVVQAVAHVHRQQEAFDVERRVEARLDLADRVEQFGESFEGEVFALHGDQHRIGSRENVHRGVSQRGGAVDEDVVEAFAHGVDDAFHDEVSVLHLRQFGVGGHQVDRRGQDPEVLHVGAAEDHLVGLFLSGEAFVDAFEVDVEAQPRGGVGLRIGVQQQHLFAQQGQRCRQIDGRVVLPTPPFWLAKAITFPMFQIRFISRQIYANNIARANPGRAFRKMAPAGGCGAYRGVRAINSDFRGSRKRIFRIFGGCMPGSGFPAACTRKRGGREQDPGRRAPRRPKGPDRPMYAMTDRREHKQEEPVRENPTVKPLSETDSKREPKSDAGSNPQAAPKPAASRFPTAGDLLAMLGIALAAQILIGIVGQLLAAGFGIDFQTAAPNIQGRMMAVLYFISMSVALGGVLYYRHVRGGRGRWARFSLRGLNPTLLLWCFILIFAVGIVLEPLLQVMPELQLQVGRGFWTLLSLVVFAPIFEELLCRGVVLGSLRDRYGVTAAWLVSALFFGLLHVQPVQVITPRPSD